MAALSDAAALDLPAPRRRPLARALVAVLVYPRLFWWLSALSGAAVRRRLAHRGGIARIAARLVHGATYLTLGLPLTLLVTGELLIGVNELFRGEEADYRLRSDFAEGVTATLVVPGPQTPPPAPRAGDPDARELVERYAPVILQKLADHPEWDLPVAIDFDGNADPRDNVVNEPRFRPHQGRVYGELTAETEDSYYLTYSLYHVKDYDHPVRQLISSWTFHDSDNEGLHLRVDKASGRVVEVETWFHNRFLLFNTTGESRGSEPVHGKLHLEGGTHVIVYAQPQGHGVRCAQAGDVESLGRNVKVLRLRGERPAVPVSVDARVQLDATYDLESFDGWYAAARGPFGTKGTGEGLFEETIPLGRYPDGRPLVIGRFIAGRDYAKGSWSRPKPPWSWDDGWDDIPVFTWHFFPAEAFASHGGSDLSTVYLHNRPAEQTFGMSAGELEELLALEVTHRRGEKWRNKNRTAELHGKYWRAALVVAKRYVNYLFRALG